jgi:hypothetical protein
MLTAQHGAGRLFAVKVNVARLNVHTAINTLRTLAKTHHGSAEAPMATGLITESTETGAALTLLRLRGAGADEPA